MTKSPKVIIINAHLHDAETLRSSVLRCAPTAKVLSVCTNERAARQQLRRHQPDVVFVSLDLPELYSKEGLLTQIKQATFSLILTAKEISSDRVNKLIDFNAKRDGPPARFLKQPAAAQELKTLMSSLQPLQQSAPARPVPSATPLLPRSKWLIEIEGQYYLRYKKGPQGLVRTDDLCYCKADGNYIHLMCQEHFAASFRRVIRCTMGQMSAVLTPLGFFRTHASFLVNLRKVDLKQVSLVNGDTGSGGSITMKQDCKPYNGIIPLARSKKQAFKDALGELGLII